MKVLKGHPNTVLYKKGSLAVIIVCTCTSFDHRVYQTWPHFMLLVYPNIPMTILLSAISNFVGLCANSCFTIQTRFLSFYVTSKHTSRYGLSHTKPKYLGSLVSIYTAFDIFASSLPSAISFPFMSLKIVHLLGSR